MSTASVNNLAENCKPSRLRNDIEGLVKLPPFAWLRPHFELSVRAGRSRAKKCGRAYHLTVDDLMALAERQNFRCALSGIEFVQSRAFWGYKSAGREPFSVSIDRIDNAVGYTIENVRLVALIVNLARSTFGDDAVVTMARAIAARFPSDG